MPQSARCSQGCVNVQYRLRTCYGLGPVGLRVFPSSPAILSACLQSRHLLPLLFLQVKNEQCVLTLLVRSGVSWVVNTRHNFCVHEGKFSILSSWFLTYLPKVKEGKNGGREGEGGSLPCFLTAFKEGFGGMAGRRSLLWPQFPPPTSVAVFYGPTAFLMAFFLKQCKCSCSVEGGHSLSI